MSAFWSKGPAKDPVETPENATRLHVRFVGRVQGVGFRWTALMVARERLVSAACAWLERRGLSGGRGRAVRTAPCSDLRDLRVLVDSSAVEVFANDGELAFATRWFPRSPALSLAASGVDGVTAWEMGDGMSGTYPPAGQDGVM